MKLCELMGAGTPVVLILVNGRPVSFETDPSTNPGGYSSFLDYPNLVAVLTAWRPGEEVRLCFRLVARLVISRASLSVLLFRYTCERTHTYSLFFIRPLASARYVTDGDSFSGMNAHRCCLPFAVCRLPFACCVSLAPARQREEQPSSICYLGKW